ncbi:MAG: methyltransferase domain-containing protein [candidate division WOR-3 bacterium]
MKDLLSKKFWDEKYNKDKIDDQMYISKFSKFSRLLSPYVNEIILKIIYDTLRGKQIKKIVEIGSAPGYFVCEVAKGLKSIPFGIEISSTGYEMNRKVFQKKGYDQNNVIFADFFSDKIDGYENFFDLVLSRGFIEHFDDPEEVLKKHLKILKEDGFLVVTVPNKTGFNKILTNFLNEKSLEGHNLETMKLSFFKDFAKKNHLEICFLGYAGIFDLYQFNPSKKKRKIFDLMMKIQKILYIFYRLKPHSLNLDSKIFSPLIVFIAKK